MERQSGFVAAFDAEPFDDAFVKVIAADTSLGVVAVELIAFRFGASESAAAVTDYSSSWDYFAQPADIDSQGSNSMAALFGCSLLVELVVARY